MYKGKYHHLGLFNEDEAAARAFDEAARWLRPKGKAHGGRAGSNWHRPNSPTIAETAFAEGEGMPPQKKRK
jgi:hypothetical protein